MPTEDAKFYWSLGVRDGYAFVFAEIRTHGTEAGLRSIANALLKMNPEHCHAAWWVEEHGEPPREKPPILTDVLGEKLSGR